jgi:hypothetical protein
MTPQPPFNVNDVANWITAFSGLIVHFIVAYPMVAIVALIVIAICAYLPPIVWLIGLLILVAFLTANHLW